MQLPAFDIDDEGLLAKRIKEYDGFICFTLIVCICCFWVLRGTVPIVCAVSFIACSLWHLFEGEPAGIGIGSFAKVAVANRQPFDQICVD